MVDRVPRRMPTAARFSLLAAAAAALMLLAGCSASSNPSSTDLVSGKKLFVSKCGGCHTLARAETKGTQGPNLDDAFANAVSEGFGESAIRGMVRQMIDIGPATAGDKVIMKPDLVTGDDARNVAAYVASVVDKKGKDEGLLATVGKATQCKDPIQAQGGKLTIPADPGGQLAFTCAKAEAPAGQLTIEMPNKAGIDHDIVIDGKGQGKVVGNGGTSSFSASFTPGTYTYYCSVEGHRTAGMEGKLTVK
jgi:plastocyanin